MKEDERRDIDGDVLADDGAGRGTIDGLFLFIQEIHGFLFSQRKKTQTTQRRSTIRSSLTTPEAALLATELIITGPGVKKLLSKRERTSFSDQAEGSLVPDTESMRTMPWSCSAWVAFTTP